MSNQPPQVILTIQTGPQAGQTYQLSSGAYTLGRTPGNQIVISEPTISKQHARLTVQADGVLIQDLGSSNGTFVNSQRLITPTWLQPGDAIQIGSSVMLGIQIAGLQIIQPSHTPMVVTPPRQRTGLWIIAIMVVLLLLVAGMGAVAWWFLWPSVPTTPSPPVPGPTILVYKPPEPENKTNLHLPLFIYATARDEKKVSRAELWVNGQLVNAKLSDLPNGITPFTFALNWIPPATGPHNFLVRAYSTDGRVGQSNVIDIDALQVISEGDEFPYVIQEGDTLKSIAETLGVSAETILTLNPIIEEVAVEQDVPPLEIILPPNQRITVPVPDNFDPSLIPPRPPLFVPPIPDSPDLSLRPTLSIPEAACNQVGLRWTAIEGKIGYNIYRRALNSSVFHFLWQTGTLETTFLDTSLNGDGSWEYYVATVNLDGSEGLRSESRFVTITNCSSTAPPVRLFLKVDEFWPNNVTLPHENIYCHIALGPLNGTQSQQKALNEAKQSVEFGVQPDGPLQVRFDCFYQEETNKTPIYLGSIEEIRPQHEWQNEQVLKTALSINSKPAYYVFRLAYRLCVAPCPPEAASQSSPLPPVEPNPPAGSINPNIAPPKVSLNDTMLSWIWDTNGQYNNETISGFNIKMRQLREGQQIGQAVDTEVRPGNIRAWDLGRINRGCGVTVVYEVSAFVELPNGIYSWSEPGSESIISLPPEPCQAKVTVTFNTLQAWDVNDGWFGLDNTLEVFGWLTVNGQPYQWKGTSSSDTHNIGEDNYSWSTLVPNQAHVFNLLLDKDDDVSLAATLFDDDKGLWCQQQLLLPARAPTNWAALKNWEGTLTPYPLNQSTPTNEGQCTITVLITGEVIP